MNKSRDQFTYLALGDSYTIGEGVGEADRWPIQLYKRLKKDGIQVDFPMIVAETGWTTDDLLAEIEQLNKEAKSFDLVSLQIGVNNQYEGYSLDIYRDELPLLIDQAIMLAGGDNSKVLILSIPDYGVSPFGKGRGSERIAVEIDTYNTLTKIISEQKNVQYFDVTHISRKAENEADLLADDGLHPSGKMYEMWVNLIYPWVRSILDQ